MHLDHILFTVLLAAGLSLPVKSQNPKPFTVPEVKEWKGFTGQFHPSGHIVCSDDTTRTIAQQLATDYKQLFGRQLTVVSGKASTGDIVLRQRASRKLGAEGYTLTVGSTALISAPHARGLYWGTRTLLQLSEQTADRSLPQGQITDYPDYAFRGFMLDCGRKFFPMEMLRQYVKVMAYYKMNAFHIHINDNAFPWFYNGDWSKTPAAFRLESDRFPGLTARDGHYTKADFIALQQMADSVGVEIIPEIDVPAHSLALTRYRPSLGSKDFGSDHLDLLNPDTYSFCDSLFEEYLEGPNPVFRGKYVHIGTDEYSNRRQDVVEKFRGFTDRYIRLVERYGRKAAIWGQQTHAKGTTPVKVKDVLMYCWSNDYSQPEEMMRLGYHIVSIPDRYVYIVPKAGYYYDYLNTQWLYTHWTPALVNGIQFPERTKLIEGGAFAVWNDIAGNGISDKDVHYRVMPAMQTLATKMWTGANPSFSYNDFSIRRLSLSEAPGVNYAGREPAGTVLNLDKVEPGSRLPLSQIGWNYSVSFDIEAAGEALETPLFSFGDTHFWLSDPIAGQLGFSRDGYLYHFGYQFFPGEKAHVEVRGNEEKTVLIVNGKTVANLDVRKINFGKRGDMYYVSTLVFPLKQAGSFKSHISHLKVESLSAQ